MAGKARLVGHELEGESWLCDFQKLPILGTLASPPCRTGVLVLGENVRLCLPGLQE